MNEQLIYKYLSRQASRAEELELLEWLTVSEDNKKIFFEMKAIWSASWVAAMDARLPTRESVADDIGVLVLNGDLPFDMEDLADWVQAGHLPVVKQK